LAAFLVVALLFALVPLGLARLWARHFAPPKPGPIKNSIYECGLESRGDAWRPFRSSYYIYAIVFLVFDVEIVFLLPFAVAFGGLTVGAVLAMMLFLALLVEGLLWAWAKGVLRWV
jgi:NADH-quinone oxidoreductase subunit A